MSRISLPFVAGELVDILCLYLLLQHTTMPATNSTAAISTSSPPTDAVGAVTSLRNSWLSDNIWVLLSSSELSVDVSTEFEVVVASFGLVPTIDKRIDNYVIEPRTQAFPYVFFNIDIGKHGKALM